MKNRIEINEDIFIRLAIETLDRKKDIGNFADNDGNICLIKASNKSLYWIVKGNVAETHDGHVNLAKSDVTLIGRHSETLRPTFLYRSDIVKLIGKTTIDNFAEELRELYCEYTGFDGSVEERKKKRALLLRYFREIRDVYRNLKMMEDENFLSYAERIGKDRANCYVKKYHDILLVAMESIGEISAMFFLTDNENERHIYERTIDTIVDEALRRMP
ncbi:MAG: hypothetical protein HDS84_01385 [Bacteroidales bacterium]|nr:hypothetical protein [Bacteroidales bacterium]